MIHICNWILTRKCNLNCSYCRITKNYDSMPLLYPRMKDYYKNEMSTEYVIKCLSRVKKHNPDCFHIFYGGEPLLRKDLPDIINYCNKEDIHYTIISNNTDLIQQNLNKLINETDYIKGFTSSIDPVIVDDNVQKNDDIYQKSINGFERLKEMKKYVNDVVAEITASKSNINLLPKLCNLLQDNGIGADITFIDIAKNEYYDFSNITDSPELVEPDSNTMRILGQVLEECTNVHMKEKLIPMAFYSLPANFDCKLDPKNFHNVSIDADGSTRLCLRIKGLASGSKYFSNIINEKGNIDRLFMQLISHDKSKLCKGCNWTCAMMSLLLEKDKNLQDDLLHSNIRRG